MYLKFLIPIVCISMLAASCAKDPNDPSIPSDPIILECRYDGDATLIDHNPTGVDYIAECVIEVFGGTLTIEPGVTIQFKPGTSMKVDIDGGLSAVGTSDEPITFTSTAAGNTPSWKGILLATDNVFNRLDHCLIEHAGSSSLSVLHGPAAVAIWNQASVTNTTFHNSGGLGLLIYEEAADVLEFHTNTFTNNQTFPLEVEAGEVSNLDFSSCLFSNNGADKISIRPRGNTLKNEHTWIDAGVPYLLLEEMEIRGELTLEQGLHLQMANNTRISMQSLSGNEHSLAINGVANNPVIIEGEEPLAGYWDGIEVRSNSIKNRFDYLIIRDGGAQAMTWSDFKGNIALWGNKSLTINNLISENSAECDIVLQDTDTASLTLNDSEDINVCED